MASQGSSGQKNPVPSSRGRAPPIPDTEPLLGGRQTPPPRYSSIGPSWTSNDSQVQHLPRSDSSTVTKTSNAPVTSPPPFPPAPAVVPPPPSATTATIPHHGHHQQQPLSQPTFAYPAWWTWVPGPAQMFPPGLEHLTMAESLTITKKGRRYRVLKDNQQIYSVRRIKQDDGQVSVKIMNNANLDVLILTCSREAQGCCTSNTHVEVCFPPGNIVGVVQGSTMEYTVHNPSGDLLFYIEREQATCKAKPGYQISTRERVNLGSISRYRSACCSVRKSTLLILPQQLDLHYKALLLAGTVALITC